MSQGPERPPGRVAIVGGGLAGFVAYLTLLHGKLDPGDITVFADERDPAGPWRRRASSIRQQLMRSESDGHCLPRSFPGLAVRAARRQGVVPLALSICNRYHPTVDEFLDHVDDVRARCAWDQRVRLDRIGRVLGVAGGFRLDTHGVFRHVLLATGHPGLAVPPELAGDRRTVHAYEPHDYAAEVAIVGSGMAAATEWLNALSAGARVVSVRRHEPARRPLTVSRDLFSRRGLADYQATGATRRVEVLEQLLTPSYPAGREWDEPIERAEHEGRFRVAASVNGEAQVICATGFLNSVAHDPLIAALAHDHGVETRDRWLVLGNDCTVPSLTDDARTLSVTGVLAQWAYPAADTLVGMKYAARSFLRRVEACRTR
jgi:cation diffusion facilitator CzcD-associated flavoprotein CzcO